MKAEQLGTTLIVVVAVAVVATIAIVVIKLKLEMVFTLALILVVAVALAVLGVAAALIVKAKTPQGPHEREIIREKHTKHTIDGRKEPRVHVLPGPGGQTGGMYPEVLRAAFLAGGAERRRLGDGQTVEGEWSEWEGPIATTQKGREGG